MASETDIDKLELLSIIGFGGNAMKGLRIHPDGEHIIYPFGTKVAIQNLITRKNRYLDGHNNLISTVAISRSGKYVASGQINHMGFKAPVIVWDYEKGTETFSHDSHKVRVENVQFSICENYIISLGGRDDANVVVFAFHTREAICGVFSSTLSAGDAVTIAAMNTRNVCFATGGVYTLRIWTLDHKNRSVSGADVNMGKIRRKITCIEVDKLDEYAWCGTSTGDVMKVKLAFSKTDKKNVHPVSVPSLVGCYAKHPPVKKKNIEPALWCLGVRALVLLKNDELLIGSGDGTVDYVSQKPIKLEKIAGVYKLSNPTVPHFIVEKTACVGGLVTSMEILKNKKDIIVGTIKSEMYLIDIDTFEIKLYLTCHTEPIFGVAFPRHYSDVFATASKDDIRVWSVSRSCELLRISVPNFACTTICFAPNGKGIISGWNDGNIRAFTPQSGKLMFTIFDAHNKGVSALAMTSDCKKLLTGGVEGQVRIWEILKETRRLLVVLKEHKAPVTGVDIAPNDKEAVSASSDGSCIIWDLVKCVRFAILFSSTLFMAVKYHPSGCQLVTTGTNRQLGYWEVYDGSLVREIEGSKSAAVNTLDISTDGKYMATGGNDKYVKVWLYKEGYATHIGLGHGGVISAIRFSADMKTLVSCSVDGAIFIWKTPFENEDETKQPEEKNDSAAEKPEEKNDSGAEKPEEKNDSAVEKPEEKKPAGKNC